MCERNLNWYAELIDGTHWRAQSAHGRKERRSAPEATCEWLYKHEVSIHAGDDLIKEAVKRPIRIQNFEMACKLRRRRD